ncbi:hypothetical protein HY623_00930 [Candidatus Uhrbacteria bacterium]|nr:hypothetical protein [Candidatus Uhrbacteria bacterium]
MTEHMYEKQIAELGDEMDKKLKKLSEADSLPSEEFVARACILRAALQDVYANARGETPNSVFELQALLSSEEARNEKERGEFRHISVLPDTLKEEIVIRVASLLRNHPPYDTIAYPPMIREATGLTGSKRQYSESLERDLEQADVSSHVLAFVWGERIRAAVSTMLSTKLCELLNKHVDLSVGGSPEAFWRLQLLGVRQDEEYVEYGLLFLQKFTQRMNALTQRSAEMFYGDEAARALLLWRALLSVKRGTKPIKEFRQACASALVYHRYSEAEEELSRAVAKTPLLFTEAQRKTFHAKRLIPAEPKTQEQPLSLYQQRTREQLSRIETFVGKTFVSKKGHLWHVVKAGLEVVYGQRGFHPGVKLLKFGTKKYPRVNPTYAPTTYLSPNEFLGKMEREEWNEWNPK